MTVLLVEDDPAVRAIFAETLQRAGFATVEAGSAEEALTLLERTLPSVILLDLGMPTGRMSGIEVLAKLRETATTARVPVVIVSGMGESVNPDVTTRLRVAATLTKPVAPADLVREVRLAANLNVSPLEDGSGGKV